MPVLLLLLVLLYFPLFHHLTWLPIRIWDEARLAMNAWEAFHNGHWFIPHFEGKPDMWSTKPPLLPIMQALLTYVTGPGELAIRLPAAMAGLGSCLLIAWWINKRLAMPEAAFMAALVLVTSQGYVHQHATRTGDYDAVLSFFMLWASLSWFDAMFFGRTKALFWFWISLTLGVMTKSIAALFFSPAYLLFGLVNLKSFLVGIRSRPFLFGMLVFIFTVAGYYLVRETFNHGYLQAVWDNELGGRYAGVIETHHHGLWFFLQRLVHTEYSEWFVLLIPGLIIGSARRDAALRASGNYVLLLILVYLLIISLAATQLEWYDVPLFPVMALPVALLLYTGWQWLSGSPVLSKRIKPLALFLAFAFIVFYVPYGRMLGKTFEPQEYPEERVFYRIGHFLQDARDGLYSLDGFRLLQVDYSAHNDIYLEWMRYEGTDVARTSFEMLEPGDRLIIFQDHVKEQIDAHWSYEIMDTYYEILLIRLEQRRVNSSKTP